MKWLEAVIETTPQGVEPVTGLLLSAGIGGMQIEDEEEMQSFILNNPQQWDYVEDSLLQKEKGATRVKFYVSDEEGALTAIREGLSNLKTLSMDLGSLYLKTVWVDDEDWIDNWRKYYKPFSVGTRFIIKPLWCDYDNIENRLVLEIEPGPVFGSGLHQSTQLCIEQLETCVNSETSLLDLGCGSGILSIAGLLLGAKKALALDMDTHAARIASQNASFNGIGEERYSALTGNILEELDLQNRVRQEKYSIIVANIVADVIINLAELAADCLWDNGVFIASGIIREREKEVLECLTKKGFISDSITCRDEWVCMTFRLKEGFSA